MTAEKEKKNKTKTNAKSGCHKCRTHKAETTVQYFLSDTT